MTIKNLAAAAFAAAALISVPASLGTSLTGSTPSNSITAEAASDYIGNCSRAGTFQGKKAYAADGLGYIIEGSTATLIGRPSNASAVIMHDKVKIEGKTYNVTKVHSDAFKGTSGTYAIKEFKAGKNLEEIGENAFKDSPVRTIVLNSGLKKIGSNAFSGTLVKEVDIPGSVTLIQEEAFMNTPISTLSLHSGLTTIGNDAFHNTSVEEIVIPATVTKIGTHAFDGCNLKTVYIDASGDQKKITIEDTAFAYNEQLKYLYNYRKNITVAGTSFKRDTPYINDDDDPNCFIISGQRRAYLEDIIFGM